MALTTYLRHFTKALASVKVTIFIVYCIVANSVHNRQSNQQ